MRVDHLNVHLGVPCRRAAGWSAARFHPAARQPGAIAELRRSHGHEVDIFCGHDLSEFDNLAGLTGNDPTADRGRAAAEAGTDGRGLPGSRDSRLLPGFRVPHSSSLPHAPGSFRRLARWSRCGRRRTHPGLPSPSIPIACLPLRRSRGDHAQFRGRSLLAACRADRPGRSPPDRAAPRRRPSLVIPCAAGTTSRRWRSTNARPGNLPVAGPPAADDPSMFRS